MRQGDLSRGEELLSAMDDIYNVLVTIDFPDAITGGRKTWRPGWISWRRV